MTRAQLEKEFTSMLYQTDTHLAYHNLTDHYIRTAKDNFPLSEEESKAKLKDIREGDPKEWVSKVFSEGLDTPPKLYQISTLWLKHLEDINWEQK